MITINKKKFRQNFKYMAIIFIVLVLFVIIVSLLGYGGSPNSYSEYDLEENGSYDISKLLINEIANNNDGGYASEEGNSYDWIELYNGTGKDINLKGYTLTDDESKVKWAFEDTTIKSKEYLIIFLAGENKDGLYTNFSLSKSGGEKVILKTPNGKVVDMVETLKTSKNTSMARNLDGAWHIVRQITPGYINTLEGYNEYLKSIEAITSDIIINEVLVRNGGQFKDEFGDYSGYIELKNTTDNKINLKNYSLSNSIYTHSISNSILNKKKYNELLRQSSSFVFKKDNNHRQMLKKMLLSSMSNNSIFNNSKKNNNITEDIHKKKYLVLNTNNTLSFSRCLTYRNSQNSSIIKNTVKKSNKNRLGNIKSHISSYKAKKDLFNKKEKIIYSKNKIPIVKIQKEK